MAVSKRGAFYHYRFILDGHDGPVSNDSYKAAEPIDSIVVDDGVSPTILRHDFLAWVPDNLLRQWKLVVEPERKEIVATVTAEAIDARVGIDRISERIELQLSKIFARVPSLTEAIEHHWKPL